MDKRIKNKIMEWIIKIEGKPNQRISVYFDSNVNGNLVFFGEYKPKNKEWVTFVKKIPSTPINELNDLNTILEDVSIEMSNLVKKYEKYSEIFSLVKEIKILEDLDNN